MESEEICGSENSRLHHEDERSRHRRHNTAGDITFFVPGNRSLVALQYWSWICAKEYPVSFSDVKVLFAQNCTKNVVCMVFAMGSE
jgi:hypothetical protein